VPGSTSATDLRRIVVIWLVLLSLVSCTSKPVRVSVVFENGWALGNEILTEPEKSLVKRTALQTLRNAYSGFRMVFSEGSSADRVIKVEDTPYATFSGSLRRVGVVGMTYPFTKFSSVRLDALYRAELSMARCEGISGCTSMTREQLLTGLGKGVGATAAHELGHQAGFIFSTDSQCDDCYDSHSAISYAHFFAIKHWSDAAMAIMRRRIPLASAILTLPSTTAPRLLRGSLRVSEFVNAHTLAQGLSAFRPEDAALQAGRIMLARL